MIKCRRHISIAAKLNSISTTSAKAISANGAAAVANTPTTGSSFIAAVINA